jgi:hypothetical protein
MSLDPFLVPAEEEGDVPPKRLPTADAGHGRPTDG